MGAAAAVVDVLTAEVRALMIGSRQVTLSVYRQLDTVEHTECEPFGRVRDSKDVHGYVWVIGRRTTDGALVRSSRVEPREPDATQEAPFEVKWADVTYTRDDGSPRAIVGQEEGYRGYWVAQVLVDAGDEVRWAIPTSYHEYSIHGIPVGWRYRNAGIAEDAERLAWADLHLLREVRTRYEEWMALPLIVLAGLK